MSGFKKIIIENKYQKNINQRIICFRSSWETSFASFLDNNTNVKFWITDYRIKYLDRFSQSPKVRQYLVDFKVEMVDGSTLLVEIKPIKSLVMRVATQSMRYKRIHTSNYLKNLAKFETVELFCQKIGWKFFLAEKEEHKFRFYQWDIKNRKPIIV